MVIMRYLNELKQSALVSLWFIFLTFPIMVIRVNTVENVVEWRWRNMAWIGIVSFFLAFLRHRLPGRSLPTQSQFDPQSSFLAKTVKRIRSERRFYLPLLVLFICGLAIFPFVFSMYQTNIMISALIYIMLGLGLNIVVGLAGLLDLGYVAFYAAGAYTYALLNHHFGLNFWMALPIGGLVGALFGILLGYPVLRLRGDYLAIVTLGFGEIIRLVLENWNDFSFGPSGIANIPRPAIWGGAMSLKGNTIFLYFLMIGLVGFTIFVVNRLQNSRIGRAWIALREDEIACQAMGIDKAKTKLLAFALGATWAGMAGVIFAAKTMFINPASFTIWESIIILCIVVLGGMGSIIGVICGALVLILLPEYLRAFSDYRMLVFGAVLVIMMLFRPGGIIPDIRKTYMYKKHKPVDG